MNQELKNLLNTFENKLASLWQLDGQLKEVEDDDRAYRLETRQAAVQKEADTARDNLIAAIEQLETKAVEDSWARNPDRMGGQFTPDEIDATTWGGYSSW